MDIAFQHVMNCVLMSLKLKNPLRITKGQYHSLLASEHQKRPTQRAICGENNDSVTLSG